MKKLFTVGVFLLLLVSHTMSLTAQDIKSLPPEKLWQLVQLRESIMTLSDNLNAGIITSEQEERGVKRYLEKASQIAGRPITVQEIGSFADPNKPTEVKLTALQRFAGLVTFINILWVFAIVGTVVCGVYLFGDLIVTILSGIPVEFYELLLYIVSIVLLIYGTRLSPGVSPYVGLTGCLLFGGAIFLTKSLHDISGGFTIIWLIISAIWGTVAVLYGSQMIGFITVGALMSLLGFSGAVYPFLIVVGFKNEDSLGKATGAAFAMVILYSLATIFNINLQILNVFRSGALFLGCFIGFLGLDIASTRWYYGRQRNYLIFQIITIVAGILAIYFGSVYGIGELQKIGGTFFVIFILTKLSEIPAESMRGYALIGLIASGLIYAFCSYVKSHPTLLAPYLFMPS